MTNIESHYAGSRHVLPRQEAVSPDRPLAAEPVAANASKRRRLPRRTAINPAVALALDALVILCAGLLSGIGYHRIAFGSTGDIVTFFGIGVLISALYCGVFRGTQTRQPLPTNSFRTLRSGAWAWTLAFLLFLLIVFTLKVSADLSRGATLSLYFVGLSAIAMSRTQFAPLIARLAPRLAMARDIILIGAKDDGRFAGLVDDVRATTCPHAAVVALNARGPAAEWAEECRRFIDHVYDTARTGRRGEIIISISGIPQDRVAVILRVLSRLPRAVFVVPDPETAELLRRPVATLGAGLAVRMQTEPLNIMQRCVKRSIDAGGAILLMIVLLPLLAGIALAIKLDSPGPVLFRQKRRGYRGRPFNILKFRTMSVQENGPVIVQARKDDERVTRVGHWLRRTSFDELPQLVNVLRGEMSLIGPRPHAFAHDGHYAGLIENYEIRQHVKPGLTGWAQVNGLRGETATEESMLRRIEYDLWYVTNCNLLLDLQILARTALEVLRQRNAW